MLHGRGDVGGDEVERHQLFGLVPSNQIPFDCYATLLEDGRDTLTSAVVEMDAIAAAGEGGRRRHPPWAAAHDKDAIDGTHDYRTCNS